MSFPQCHTAVEATEIAVSTHVCLHVCVFPQVFDGAVIVLSLAPMVASTVANGPSSPWDAIGLIITLRIWRVKRIIDGETRRGWGLMSPASCPLLSGYRDRYCSVLSVVTAHLILKLFALLFLFIHYFPAETLVNDLWFEAYTAAATCSLFCRIDADRPLAIWGRFFRFFWQHCSPLWLFSIARHALQMQKECVKH